MTIKRNEPDGSPDLKGSTTLSRRRFLGGVAGLSISTPAQAQPTTDAPTTNADALEGMAVEPKPDFILVARFATYDVEFLYGVDEDGTPNPTSSRKKLGKFKFRTRSWFREGEEDDNYLGPLLELKPGQKFTVLVKNELFEEGDYKNYGPPALKPEDWMTIINQKFWPQSFFDTEMPYFNSCTPDTPIDQFTVDWENVPKNFNWTNLHLHGLQIDPHLFAPQGTSDPEADYITIKPGGQHLYTFQLPDDHPAGTFWYHPHRHNSIAIQAWCGMAGMLLVRGTFDEELAGYGVSTEIPFVVHDPHYEILKYPKGDEPGIAKIGPFLANQTDQIDSTYMVTGRYQPTYTVKKNEIVHLRHLTSTPENIASFRITPSDDTDSSDASEGVEGNNLPFYMIASDGIAFDKPVKKTVMVTAGGERHDLLFSFSEPGEYLIRSDHIETIQFFGTGPDDHILARFVVLDEDAGAPATPIEEMTFTPGIPESDAPGIGDIQETEIVRRRHFVFDMDANTCYLPYQQFRINDTIYRSKQVDFEIEQGTVEEWVMINPTNGVHPFHVHVNPFQVKEAYSAVSARQDQAGEAAAIVQSRLDAVKTIDKPNQWRDTMMIPPKGYLRLWTRMHSERVGKTVLHCHFLAHEETAMLQNFLIKPKPQDN